MTSNARVSKLHMLVTEIEKLIDLVNDSGVTGITLETPGRRVSIRKGASAPVLRDLAVVQEHPIHEAEEAHEVAAAEPVSLTHWIHAPMVGIFYHAEPPVAPGTTIEAGQEVGVIESMKLMNDIRAEENGVVKEALVEAGMAVEYGQPLFLVEVG